MIELDNEVINMLRHIEQDTVNGGRELASSVDDILFRQTPADMQVYNAAATLYPLFAAAGFGQRHDEDKRRY